MAVLGLQGVRGGVGTTTITAALAWSLQMLGGNVLVVDACPDNLLRLSFNVDFTHRQGWARAMLDGQVWRDAGLRYTSQLDLLPFGQLSIEEQENPQHWQTRLSDICSGCYRLQPCTAGVCRPLSGRVRKPGQHHALAGCWAEQWTGSDLSDPECEE